jgi:hypothetical protein
MTEHPTNFIQTFERGSVATRDGVNLSYLESSPHPVSTSSGFTVLLIPGWSQTAAQYKHQLRGIWFFKVFLTILLLRSKLGWS